MAKVDEHLEIIRRRRDESTFSQHRLRDHGRDFFVRDDTFERVFEMARAVEVA